MKRIIEINKILHKVEIPLSVCELKLCLFTFATDKHLYTHVDMTT